MQSDHITFYERQISLTEWFEAIGHPQAAALRLEDSDKRERLGVLNSVIGLPFDKPTVFRAADVLHRSPAFKAFLSKHSGERCALHVIPDTPTMPKLRIRGETIGSSTKWFDEQKVDPAHYRVSFAPHAESKWATIFIISKQGVFGEVTRGAHNELTQGLYKKHTPITFRYDFKNWTLSEEAPEIAAHLKEVVGYLHITDANKRQELQKAVGATFTHNYLMGYFETTAGNDYGIWFIDYNRMLGEELMPALPTNANQQTALVRGRAASPGTVTGTVRIVHPEEITTAQLSKNDVLVCVMTTPDYVPLMQQAAAIVTDLGGVLSHAAIIARELKKPCITGTKDATAKLKNGQKVTVNADAGIVTSA